MTNEKLVKDIMNFSKFGALSQVMVMQALSYYTNMVIEQEEELLKEEAENQASGKNSIINLEAWVGVAKEMKQRLDDNLK